MSFRRAGRAIALGSMLTVLTAVGAITAPPALAAVPGPTMDSTSEGQTINYDGDISVRVEPVAGASGYLYGFFQNSTMVWENYANERRLSGTDYTIAANTPRMQRSSQERSRFGHEH